MTKRLKNWRNHFLWIGPTLVATGTLLYVSNLSLGRLLLPFRETTLWAEVFGAAFCLFAIAVVRRRGGPTWKKIPPTFCILVAIGTAAWIYEREYAAYREELVQFDHEGATLRGTLYLPKTNGPHAAIVIVHGSGSFKRRLYRIWADRIVRTGVAVLVYDKRGVGDSTGEYEGNNNTSRKNINLLASDAVAAVSYLSARNDIRKDEIGLLGVSQGGWLAPLAAEQSGHVAFMVFLSGPTVTLAEQNAYEKLADAYHGDGKKAGSISWEELEQRAEQVPPSGFDPAPVLQRLNIPGLWLFGGRDKLVPVKKSVARLDDLIVNQKKPYQYVVFPYANHLLLVSEGPDARLIPEFAPGYWEKLLGWISEQVKAR